MIAKKIGSACNLCGAKRARILFPRGAYPDGYQMDVLRCQECGLIYRALQGGYSNDELHGMQRRDVPDKFTLGRLELFQRYVEVIEKYRNVNRVLDVGAGEGHFLHLCSEKGWQVSGVDNNRQLIRDAAVNYDIHLFHGTVEAAEYPEKFFDVVTLWNVIEHVADPMSTFRDIYRILRPGGAVFLRLTNAEFHVPCRQFLVKINQIKGKSSRHGFSVIHRYCMRRADVERYLTSIGFVEPEVNGAEPMSEYDHMIVAKGKWIVLMLADFTAKIAGILYRKQHLFTPSMFATGIKSA